MKKARSGVGKLCHWCWKPLGRGGVLRLDEGQDRALTLHPGCAKVFDRGAGGKEPPRVWTQKELLELYVRSCPTDTEVKNPGDPRRAAIAEEMRFLLTHGLAEGMEHIRWWKAWPSEQDLENYVQSVKKLGSKLAAAAGQAREGSPAERRSY